MRVKQVVSRVPVGLGFLAISGALFFRGTQVYGALWAGLAPLSAIFLALALPWMVSAVRSWNAWNLHNVVLLSLIFLPGGFMVAGAMAASAQHAADFRAHAVARAGTVTDVTNQPETDSDGNVVGWDSDVPLVLAQPVAGYYMVDLQLPYRPGYAAGDRVAILADPRHPGDVELPGHQGWSGGGIAWGRVGAAALIGLNALAIAALLANGPDTDGRKPDFLDATWQSWAAWRAEPQDRVPWTGPVRAVAWLPFGAVTVLAVYATVSWTLWWLFLLPAPW